MATAQNHTPRHAAAFGAGLPTPFLACADACERLAQLPRISAEIAAAALECSHACYLAAALQTPDERQVAYLVFRQCMQRCIALALACALVSDAAQCLALCRECEALCRQGCQPKQR